MKKTIYLILLTALILTAAPLTSSANEAKQTEYTVGVDDVIDINILRPEQLSTTVVVTPDGSISFPYIGTVKVKDMTLNEIQQEIQNKLADGYMKYPTVTVALRESRSRKFFVYGEVIKPGEYPMDENATILKAISMAGGFTKYGSSSRVKVLREKRDTAGYETLKINITAIMNGEAEKDIPIKAGDIIVVSEGIF